MWLRLSLIVPAIGDIGVLAVAEHETGASHAQAVEVGLGEIADVERQPLSLPACSTTNCNRMNPSPE